MAKLRDALAAKFGGAMQHSLGVGEDDTTAATSSLSPGNARNKFEGTRAARDARFIPIDQITADPSQPREDFDEESLKRLAHSLETRGQLQPIRVRWSEEEGKWMIIAGERRWRAARQSQMIRELACIVVDRTMAPDEILHEQLVENCLREDLKPIEQAKAFQRVMEARAWSATRMADELGISAPTVTRALALLRLPEDIQQAVDAGVLPPPHRGRDRLAGQPGGPSRAGPGGPVPRHDPRPGQPGGPEAQGRARRPAQGPPAEQAPHDLGKRRSH